MSFLLKANVNLSEMEQFSIITVTSVNLNWCSNLWGSGTDAFKKTENNKTFLVNVKWVGRVNVLLYPKGPLENITGPP